MTHTFASIDSSDLESVTGGGWAGDAASAVGNFGSGFAAGAVHGSNMKDDSFMARGLDRNATGTKPGVESGMMFNQALGPVGQIMSTAAKGAPSGSGGGGGGGQ